MSIFIELVCSGNTDRIREYFEESVDQVASLEIFLNKRDESGKTPLDYAAMLGREETLKYLIENGANPNSHSTRGYTALHHAASWGHLNCVKILANCGTDLLMRNAYGEIARDVAARYEKKDCVEFLKRAEAIASLQKAIKVIKGLLTDPEKNLGRLNKEDKVTGNKFCDEKNIWLMTHKDTASVELILRKKDELYESLRKVFIKLQYLDEFT